METKAPPHEGSFLFCMEVIIIIFFFLIWKKIDSDERKLNKNVKMKNEDFPIKYYKKTKR